MIYLDLKDAYFQIPVHPSSRKYLRLMWGQVAYQFTILCFSLSTAPQVFTSVLPTPVLPRRLVAAFSVKGTLGEATGCSVGHLRGAGYCGKYGKFPADTSKKDGILGDGAGHDLGEGLPLQGVHQEPRGDFQAIPPGPPYEGQGLAEATESPGLPRETGPSWQDQWNLKDHWCQTGFPTQGAHLASHTAQGQWSETERALHINVLEILAIQRSLSIFEGELEGWTIALMCDNATVVAYVKKQGGIRSRELCLITENILEWAKRRHIDLTARFIPGTTKHHRG
ncbi:uncharacterized protein [Palaemon carinicauda]|uniref:uncharacterized protein n=1 Tax=Palaemon carinicauda TaxID=392227 RepID=UPI0035B61C65